MTEKFDPDGYYVAFYHLTHGDEDANTIVKVTEEQFKAMLPFVSPSGVCEGCPEELETAVYALPDADLRPSERDAIADGHYIYFEYC